MKITVYTITDCQFSKQEREYLNSHGIQFEEKNLETNREFLTEMLAVGSNFAGTPVTKIDKDDGQTVVLKGFTKEEFDKALGMTVEPAKPVETVAQVPQAPVEAPVQVVSAPPTSSVQAPVEPPPVVPQPEVVPAPVQQVPVAPITADPAMASILSNLEQQVQQAIPVETTAAPVAPQAPTAPVAGQPTIPDPTF